tara:strand:+ start:315 stop:578 length:264 start_codon:yes stop_codon:yes gene_type:complete
MTANELAEIADGLSCEIPIREWIDNEPKNVMNDIATMLRKQQAEIEALKFRELTYEEISDIRDKYLAPKGCDIYTFAKALLQKAREK